MWYLEEDPSRQKERPWDRRPVQGRAGPSVAGVSQERTVEGAGRWQYQLMWRLWARGGTLAFTLGELEHCSRVLSREVTPSDFGLKRITRGTSLVAQWSRVRLPMQGTRVRALVQEDTTCRGATKPVRHNYWACALEPASHNYWAHAPQLLKPSRLEPVPCNKRSHRNEKPTLAATRESPCAAMRPNTAKIN